ncbi:hypothetical protein A2130_01330 [Candidatus Woesebacteria bacterium GWC2_33_12]|uniref:Carbamoyltransferase n=1 Tax=Candidatus Woesebacteria bacterium GW2011_GWB1_33_22 TaxID=1618566 RepID=A0A0G0BZ91_9BACT|nr:MAG: hypothetical protein UR29_C0012G0011 [Candidatus Woesebacteria bacterium GW2011_GWC2_33_12]KKP41766.1 MAG: hypothetical protein UR33_C0010G0011 [Candidatus Woesebacteria bacterium GW2011_GWA2_33_20]KKP44220.1 MAG: hypothetical protein UR35_C0010G0012 [Candidatus Woesebacteria bacterium GW2011_GWB1_33_22]KKP45926.1 MAG: hypothetical protein UR37_C0013G0012 [Microgenomates group bacterium GW2011_GWC1_33_28]KKP49811.1 MAG: hypothetical protein UR41_C0012G0012 [Candidatus Woesebacteria bact
MTKEVLIEGHNTTRHDGGVALQLPADGGIVAIATERIDRKKHSGNSQTAYDFARERYESESSQFGTELDHFDPNYNKNQELSHHKGHAAAAYYSSGYESSAVVVIDGQGPHSEPGQYTSTSIWKGQGDKLELVDINAEKGYSSQSLGLLYSAVTYHLGFGFLQEGKTMGLAPYGKRTEMHDFLKRYVLVKGDSYEIDPNFIEALFYSNDGRKFFHWEERKQTTRSEKLMSEILQKIGSPRKSDGPITQRDMDLAWAVQSVLEESVLATMNRAKIATGCERVCYAGGVALNSSTNGKIIESNIFKDVFILPPAGDDGQALGRLLYRKHQLQIQNQFSPFVMDHAYLGPQYIEEEIEEAIKNNGHVITSQKLEEEDLIKQTAGLVADGKVISWWQGRSEIGPRALGNRSIVANPSSEAMRDHINFNVKHREWFRPLAPSTIEEASGDIFRLDRPLPYMLAVVDVNKKYRDSLRAITHVDNSARVQTVNAHQNRRYHKLIIEVGQKTGIPVVLNTSFNDNGEPLVESPQNAIRSFLNMKVDNLILGDHLISKK